MIHDVITQSMERPEIRMSAEIGEATAELRKFMFAEVYQNPRAKVEEQKAVHLVEQLYRYYIENLAALPAKYRERIGRGEGEKEQHVCDFIAGMTDLYAVKQYQEIFIPESWKI